MVGCWTDYLLLGVLYDMTSKPCCLTTFHWLGSGTYPFGALAAKNYREAAVQEVVKYS